MNLLNKKCIPCEDKNIKPFTADEAREYLTNITGWTLDDAIKHISKTLLFADFKQAMQFVNRVADIAESEGHHPDIAIFYNKVVITLWTHSIGGLSENDFIVAVKIDEL